MGKSAQYRQTDTMHDEQPFCHNLTERRRTTVRFLGQQSEMMLDETWPQVGEMRSLWKGTTEFWTNDMPLDDTWEPNRHHSHILSLFRTHLTRDTAAVFLSLQNPVASTEHECRDPHLPVVSHTENAEEEGRGVVLGLPKLYSVYSNHHDDSSGGTESRRQGRNHGSQKVRIAGAGVRRGATFHPEYGGTHRTGSIARRGQLSQEVAERGTFGGTIFPEQSGRNSIPTGTGDGEDVPDDETVGGEVGASRSMKTGQKKRLLGGIKKTKTLWENGTKLSRRRRNYRATRTSQHSASISVRLPRLMCMRC